MGRTQEVGQVKRGLLWALIATGAVTVVAGTGVALLANRTVTTEAARYAIERFDAQIPADVRFKSCLLYTSDAADE